MAPARRITDRQMQLLVEFAEKRPDISVKRSDNGIVTYKETCVAWTRLAKELNAAGDGIVKSPDRWKRYWHLLKCRTKAKASDVRRCGNSGEIENKIYPLTEYELRIINVLQGGVPPKPVVRVKEELHPLRQVSASADRDRSQVRSYSSSEPDTDRLAEPDRLAEHDRLAEPDRLAAPDRLAKPHRLSTQDRFKRPRRKKLNEEVPRWVYDMEQRRIDSEERLAEAVVSLATTSEATLQCLQQMAATQAQLVGILDEYLHPS